MASLRFLVLLIMTIFSVLADDHESDTSDSDASDRGSQPYSEADFESEKISGGVAATIERFPYQISISVANITLCGGFILSSSWVMTAAHCIDGADVPLLTVRAGSPSASTGGTLFEATQYVVHSLYNASKNNDYDFGLVQINGSFPFGTTIKAIAIPVQSKGLPRLGNIIVAGWGIASETNPITQDLMAVNIKIIPNKICRILYTGTATITDRMFCAGKLFLAKKGACQGDIGGAAVYNNLAVGIASFGVTCGNPIFPSVFSNVATVTEWVRGVTGI